MKTGDFIISLAEQGGVELDEAQTKAISEIATDLPEGIETKIQGSLFTVESALANSEITGKIKSENFDAVDQKLIEVAKVLGLDEGFLHQLKETKGTFNRMESVGKAVLQVQKSALEKAAEGAPKGDQKELQDEIKKLNAKIASHTDDNVSKTDHQDVIDGYEDMLTDNAKALLQLQANSLFAGQNWAMDVDAEVNVMTAKMLFNTELAAKGINLVNDNGILKLQSEEGKPYFVDNKEVTPQAFANDLMAGKKLLKVTDPKIKVPTPTIITEGGTDPSVAAAMAKAQESMDAIATAKEQQTV